MPGCYLQPLFRAECPYYDLGVNCGQGADAECSVADTVGVPLPGARARIRAADRLADPGADGDIQLRGRLRK